MSRLALVNGTDLLLLSNGTDHLLLAAGAGVQIMPIGQMWM